MYIPHEQSLLFLAIVTNQEAEYFHLSSLSSVITNMTLRDTCQDGLILQDRRLWKGIAWSNILDTRIHTVYAPQIHDFRQVIQI